VSCVPWNLFTTSRKILAQLTMSKGTNKTGGTIKKELSKGDSGDVSLATSAPSLALDFGFSSFDLSVDPSNVSMPPVSLPKAPLITLPSRLDPSKRVRQVCEKRWYIFDEESVDLASAERLWTGARDSLYQFALRTDALPIQLVKRQEVIHEFYITEVDYREDLEVITGLYMKNIKSLNIVDAADFQTLFSNVEELLPVSCDLIDRFRVRRKRDHGVVQEVGDVLLETALKLAHIYEIYCSNFMLATQYLQDKSKEEGAALTSLLQVSSALIIVKSLPKSKANRFSFIR
jgi:hypothetical protein